MLVQTGLPFTRRVRSPGNLGSKKVERPEHSMRGLREFDHLRHRLASEVARSGRYTKKTPNVGSFCSNSASPLNKSAGTSRKSFPRSSAETAASRPEPQNGVC